MNALYAKIRINVLEKILGYMRVNVRYVTHRRVAILAT